MNLEYSPDQKQAIDAIVEWHKGGKPYFVLGGAAGCGKTTITATIKKFLKGSVAYATYTGKASTVVRKKLREFGIPAGDVSTIHSLIYKPVTQNGIIIDWEKVESLGHDLIIIDEASMVPKEIFEDLLSYNVPIIFVGDHFQLPPVSRDSFNLMEQTDIRLEKPHRFVENSPIIKISTQLRNRERIPYGTFGENVHKKRKRDLTEEDKDRFFRSQENKRGEAIMLCGTNKTRVSLNQRSREVFGYKGDVNKGERVICLKNSKFANIPLFNGGLGMMVNNEPQLNNFKCEIKMDDYPLMFEGSVYSDVFGTAKPDLYQDRIKYIQCFDYGYAISVHKSQGSQWKRVAVFEEECPLWDHFRWLYTGITRAEEELLIIS